jgi:vitamin B12 transporter
MRAGFLTLALGLFTIPAHAVIVQGKVTSPLGRPIAGARIQLIDLSAGTRSVANAVSGLDGSYEIRTGYAGRFLLLTTSFTYAPQIGDSFYAGRTNLIVRDIAMDLASLTPLETELPSGFLSTLAILSRHVAQVAADQVLTRQFAAEELALAPAAVLNTEGQTGQRADLLLQGGPADGLAVVLDGQPVERFGGRFAWGSLAANGFAAIASTPALEFVSGANPLYPLAAEAGTVALHTAEAGTLHPTLTYTGDAGNLHTWRDEAAFSLIHTRTDLFGDYARFDTSNALPQDREHSSTAAMNLGYHLSAQTSLRITLRNQDAAVPLPIPYELGLQPNTRDATQDLFGTVTFETRTAADWHNLVRYGAVRSREQTFAYANSAGRLVTLTGANGATVTGQATPFPIPAREDQATTRDEAAYETDYSFKPWLAGVFTARWQGERALDATPAIRETLSRTNLIFAGAVRGEFKHRLFYEASGNVTHSSLIGFTGAPHLGLTYVPVLPGERRLKGTSLHLDLGAANREPSLNEQAQGMQAPARSRTLEVSGDQTLYRRKFALHAGYFHNQFSHQSEVLSEFARTGGIGPTLSPTQAFRTQGFVSELRYQPRSRLSVFGGYTYLASLVERSAETAIFNPVTAIGLTTGLAGQRMFRRPANSGYVTAQYTGRALTFNLKASLAGRADDSTFNAALALPNRNLDHGYARLDGAFTYRLRSHVTVFTQLTNLLNNQHMGPVGYPSSPFGFRSGLKIRLGRE